MRKRSTFVVLLIVLVGLLSLAIAPAAAQDDGLLIWADDTRAPVLAELAEEFTATFGIPVTVQEVGFGDIRATLPVAGAAGEGPDIIVAVHDWIGELVLNGAVAPINLGDRAGDFTEASLNLFSYGGQLYGMPYAVENIAFYRNPELVPDAPETWDEVFAITEELVSSGASTYGWVIQTNDPYHFFGLQSAFGGYVFGLDENGNYNPNDVGIDNAGTIAAGEYLLQYVDAGYLPSGVDYDVMHNLFETGQAAMIMSGPWALPRIRQSGVPYAISNIPAGPAGPGTPFIGGQGFMISAYSENQLLAEAFLLDYIATPETMQAIYDADPRPPAFIPLLETLEDADLQAFQAAGSVGIPQPSIPEMSSVWGSWGNAVQFIITGEADPTTAFTDAAAQIRDAIAGRVSGATTGAGGETVSLPGSFQDEVGCPGEWDPACENIMMVQGEDDGIWQASFELPAGDYEYKVALNGTWDENYGLGGEAGGANIPLSLSETTTVFFLFDPETNWITDSVNSRIVTAPGSYQAAAGCPADWSPDCLISWLQDADGDGVYEKTFTTIPAGDYEAKAAINQDWGENYGVDGERDGANIPFSVPADGTPVTFSFDSASNVLTITVGE